MFFADVLSDSSHLFYSDPNFQWRVSRRSAQAASFFIHPAYGRPPGERRCHTRRLCDWGDSPGNLFGRGLYL